MNMLRQVLDRWRGLDVTVRDLPLALALVVMSFVPAFHGLGTNLGQLPERPFDALAVVAVLLQSLPLAARRRWPAATLAVVLAGFAVDQLSGYHTVAGTGLALAVLSAGIHLERRRRTLLAALPVVYVALALALDAAGGTEPVGEYVVFYAALLVVWAIGAWLRSTRLAEAERRERVASDTRTAERTRIARELHDVVTHHVTAMVVQAESARYLTAAPERLDETLTAVTETGREAIGDLRNLLDLLDPGHDGPGDRSAREPGGRSGHRPAAPTPPHADLGTLVRQTRRAGQPVELTEDGTPAPAAGPAELTAYRVVQEALTNALKHAAGRPTTVDVRHGAHEITVRVSTAGSEGLAGPGAASGPGGAAVPSGTSGDAAPSGSLRASGSGRGLVGLRERVDALGGEFGTDLLDDGGFVVRAVLPRTSADLVARP